MVKFTLLPLADSCSMLARTVTASPAEAHGSLLAAASADPTAFSSWGGLASPIESMQLECNHLNGTTWEAAGSFLSTSTADGGDWADAFLCPDMQGVVHGRACSPSSLDAAYESCTVDVCCSGDWVEAASWGQLFLYIVVIPALLGWCCQFCTESCFSRQDRPARETQRQTLTRVAFTERGKRPNCCNICLRGAVATALCSTVLCVVGVFASGFVGIVQAADTVLAWLWFVVATLAWWCCVWPALRWYRERGECWRPPCVPRAPAILGPITPTMSAGPAGAGGATRAPGRKTASGKGELSQGLLGGGEGASAWSNPVGNVSGGAGQSPNGDVALV